MKSLANKLIEYKNKDTIPMHMPGIKRNSDLISMNDPYSFDLTEIEGFDNLHHANGILKNEMQRIAGIYHADESLISVNGSTAAVISAICGSTQKRDKVLVAGSSHISIINAIYLRELIPVFLYPSMDENGIYKGISLNDIKRSIEGCQDIRAVILTSPTYEGVVSEVEPIAKYLHENGIILIVDEAHGAHFPFSNEFPVSACFSGADAVINSTHKTMPALTQTALLHINGTLIDKDKVRAFWNMLQTTSPSYILMGSISACFDFTQSHEGKKKFKHYTDALKKLRDRLKNKLTNITLFDSDDISKIVLLAPDAKTLYDKLLFKYHIQLEMATDKYVVAMTSVADKDVYYEKFFEALKELDNELASSAPDNPSKDYYPKHRRSIILPSEALEKGFLSGEYIDIENAAGMAAAETITVYPPGTPILIAGEEITDDALKYILGAYKKGYSILGVTEDRGHIRIKAIQK